MSTLRASLDTLLTLQKIDSDRDRLARALRNLESGAAVDAAAQAAQSAAAQARQDYHTASGSLKDAELELSSLEKKLQTYENRVRSGTVTNSKELMNVEKEIGQIIRLRATLDDKILGLMDEVELLKVQQAEKEATANEQDQRRKAFFENLAAERSRIETTLSDLNKQRIEVSGLVDDRELAKKYEAIRARSNSAGIAIGRTQESTCGACHMQVSSINATRARAGEQLVICENCARIMA